MWYEQLKHASYLASRFDADTLLLGYESSVASSGLRLMDTKVYGLAIQLRREMVDDTHHAWMRDAQNGHYGGWR